VSKTLDRAAKNALQVAAHKAVVATFSAGDWLALGLQTDTLKMVEGHSRLLRSLDWGDPDYADNALSIIVKMIGKDAGSLFVMLNTPKIIDWIRENETVLYAEVFGDGASDAEPPIEHANVIHDFLWRPLAETAITKGFCGKKHDKLLALLQRKADTQLPGRPKIADMQSLQDAGCDLTIDWGEGVKYGIQLKSHFDIGQPDFQAKTLSQVQDSRQHKLLRLFVLLAGDMTDPSQLQKVRGLEARVSRMADKYVLLVAPERLWTCLFGEA
jgi:hypothetical protein